MSDPQIELSIQSDVTLVGFVGRAISALLCGTGMPSYRIATFELAVVEVVTNVIEHAYQYQPGHKVDLIFQLTDNSAEVRIRDYGQALKKEVVERYTSDEVEIQKPGDSVAELPESGWGTSLVAKLCDEVRYEQVDNSNVLTLVCHIDCEAAEALPRVIWKTDSFSLVLWARTLVPGMSCG